MLRVLGLSAQHPSGLALLAILQYREAYRQIIIYQVWYWVYSIIRSSLYISADFVCFSWVSVFYLNDWKLLFFGQNFQNKKVILILAPSLFSSHCCMQFFLEYAFLVMDSSKHYFSQGHNFGLSTVTDMFMCNSNKKYYKDSSFWWVLTKPVATWSCKLTQILWLCLEFLVQEGIFHFTVLVKLRIQFLNGHFEYASRSKPSVIISNSIFYRSFIKALQRRN